MNTARMLLALLIASVAVSTNADPYSPEPTTPGAAAPPPPFTVKGKEFPPEKVYCIDPKTTCFGKALSCPKQCPQFKPSDPKAKGCSVDCSNPTCEGGVCKTRKANCEGNGAACYDPRFVGGDGIMFYFHGKAGHHFALVSDTNLQINAHFIGIRPPHRTRDFTWIQSFGVLFGSHSFTLSADRAASWDSAVDHLSFTYDDKPVVLQEGYLSTWSAGELQIERNAHVNSVTVTLPKVFEVMTTAVPVTAEDNRVHKYGIPDNDCCSHLEVQFSFFGLSERVEGVLGQTYRPDFRNPVKRGVPMPIMGGEEKYATDSILSANCKHCIFSKGEAENVAEVAGGGKVALDCGGKMSNGYRVVCRR